MEATPVTSVEIARNRLEEYIAKKLALHNTDEFSFDAWSFYTFLLKQAKRYKIVHTENAFSSAFLDDGDKALKNYQKKNEIERAEALKKYRAELDERNNDGITHVIVDGRCVRGIPDCRDCRKHCKDGKAV